VQKIDWEKVVLKYQKLVWNKAYRILGNNADACDCFQDTFFSVYQITKKQKVNNFRALLSAVAGTRAVDILRKKIRRENLNYSLQDCDNYVLSTNKQDVDIFSWELADRLRAAIATLPQVEAEVFCLRALNGLSYRQIAKHLNITCNLVGVNLHRARKKLNDMLKEKVLEEQA
jgi:RNA polymerase sigma-70 factor (ECF subfamily)